MIGKDGGDLSKAVTRERPCRFETRRSGQRRLKRDRDLFLDLDRRQRRRHRVDLHLNVGDIGNGIDREFRQRPETGRSRCQRDQQDEPAAPDGKIDDPLDHQSSSLGLESSALSANVLIAAMVSPATKPEIISRNWSSFCPSTTSRFSKPSFVRTNTTGRPFNFCIAVAGTTTGTLRSLRLIAAVTNEPGRHVLSKF